MGGYAVSDLMAVVSPPREHLGMPEIHGPSRLDLRSPPARVVIAGGGVAALETLLALRDLAGERVSTTLVAPQPTFTSSAMAVARVFARGRPRRVELAELADEFVCDNVAEVDPDAGRIRCASGKTIGYDHLVLAVGAKAPPRLVITASRSARIPPRRRCTACSRRSSGATSPRSRSSSPAARCGHFRSTSWPS